MLVVDLQKMRVPARKISELWTHQGCLTVVLALPAFLHSLLRDVGKGLLIPNGIFSKGYGRLQVRKISKCKKSDVVLEVAG